MPSVMQLVMPISVVVMAIGLCIATWSATVLPYWAVQAGHRDAQAYYSQGMGLWLNYTEHVGDPDFDPGNSLWIPEQASGVETYASQCLAQRPFCSNAIGELHVQYCTVMSVYCGFPLRLVQWAMLVLSGIATLIVVWSFVLVFTTRRTIVDHQLMHVCIGQGLVSLLVVAVWYFAFFHTVLNTTFYKDQYNRCVENATSRACWRFGTSVYLMIAIAVLYPFLSVVIANFLGQKFKRYRKTLRNLLDTSTGVEIPSVDVHVKIDKPQSAGADAKAEAEAKAKSKSTTSTTVTTTKTTISSKPLAPLRGTTLGSSSTEVEEKETHETTTTTSEGMLEIREETQL